MLAVNPITAPLPLDLEGHGVRTGSVSNSLGRVSMSAINTAFGLRSPAFGWTTVGASGFGWATCPVLGGGRSCAPQGVEFFAGLLGMGNLGSELGRMGDAIKWLGIGFSNFPGLAPVFGIEEPAC